MSDVINVGVAEVKVSLNSDILASYGLGSCVAVALYDPVRKIGGLAHVMLPESREKDRGDAPGKFGDTAVPSLAEELCRNGARMRSLRCKLVGGAQMFEIPGARNKNAGLSCGPSANIGGRNIDAVKKALKLLEIPVVAEDTGGNHGRTVMFDCSSGELEISSIYHGKISI